MRKAILAVLTVLLMFSCSSTRKRELNKSRVKETAETVEVIREKETTETKQKENEVLKVVNEKTKGEVSFTGEVADVTKPATVTEKTTDGQKVYVFENFKNVNTSNKSQKENEQTDAKKQISVDQKTETKRDNKKGSKTTLDSSNKNLDVESQKGFPWWILILASVILTGAYFYLYKRNAIVSLYNKIKGGFI